MSWRNNRSRNEQSTVPDRWLNYSNAGNRIPDTRFICMKVPLKQELCRRLAEDQWFTPAQAVSEVAKRGDGGALGLLIDLTNTNRYYDPMEVKAVGVVHAKIMVRGHEVPGPQEVQRFFAVVDQFERDQKGSHGEDASALIGVHCTHGVNRTGYLVCRYLIDRKGWTIEKAVAEFNLARGHCIERENYLDALRCPPEIPPYVELPGIEASINSCNWVSGPYRNDVINPREPVDYRSADLELPYRHRYTHYHQPRRMGEDSRSNSRGSYESSSDSYSYRGGPVASDQRYYTSQYRWRAPDGAEHTRHRHRYAPFER